MPTTTISTIIKIIKMIEPLPENQQEKVAEHLREYIAALDKEIGLNFPILNGLGFRVTRKVIVKGRNKYLKIITGWEDFLVPYDKFIAWFPTERLIYYEDGSFDVDTTGMLLCSDGKELDYGDGNKLVLGPE